MLGKNMCGEGAGAYFRIACKESGINFPACDAETFPDPIAATVGFNMAIGFFHRGKTQSALKSVRAILRSPNMSHVLLCDASLFEINVLLHMREAKALFIAVKNLQSTPWWPSATPKQKETAERLVTRARAMASKDKFALTASQQEKTGLDWLICQAEVDARSGDVENVMSRLLSARVNASREEQGLIDNTLGCIYSTVLKNPSFAEAFFRSAMKSTRRPSDTPSSGIHGGVPRSVLLHNLALSLLSQRKFKEAFKLFMLTMPFYRHCPRFWLRLAECCVLHIQKNSTNNIDDLDSDADEGFIKHAIGFRDPGDAVSSQSSLDSVARDAFHGLHLGDIPELSYTNALACLKNAQALAGDDRNYVYLLMSIHFLTSFVSIQLGRFEMALRASTALLNLPQSTSTPQVYIRSVLLKTAALDALGQHHQAIQLLDQIAAATQRLSAPVAGVTSVAYNRSVLYARMGKVSKAVEIYEQLKSMDYQEDNVCNFVVLERFLLSMVARTDGSNPHFPPHMYDNSDY